MEDIQVGDPGESPAAVVNKVMKCKHVFDCEQGDSATTLLLTCRECELFVEADAERYDYRVK